PRYTIMTVAIYSSSLLLLCVLYLSYYTSPLSFSFFFFFFNDTATTEIYTLSLHDALPISKTSCFGSSPAAIVPSACESRTALSRSEEHTSELQSLTNLVCRLLLEKKKKKNMIYNARI